MGPRNMRVKDLIAALATMDPDALVVLQKDSEGNGYSPLTGVDDNCIYVPLSTWHGEIYLRKLTPFLKEEGFGEEDVYDGSDGRPAVVLYPVN